MTYNFIGMPRDCSVQVRMSTAERRELKTLADNKGLSMSAYLRTLVKEKLEMQKKA